MAKRKSRKTKTVGRPRAARSGTRAGAAKAAARPRSPRPAAKPAAASPRRNLAGAASSGRHAPANGIGLVRHHTDYTSHDMAAIQRFYVEVLGFGPTERNGDYVVIHTSPQSSLGFMPPMPVPPEQWRPPREPALYFMVSDVDAVVRRLRDHGVSIEIEPMDTPWGHRFAAVLDPEGRHVCFAQPLPGANR